jgi:glycine betaine transporter
VIDRPPSSGRGLDSSLLALPLCALVAGLGLWKPDLVAEAANAFTGAAFQSLDWFFLLAVTAMLVFLAALAVSPWGKLKLGKPDDEPEFRTVSWLAMLFAAGMGAGLLFWGAAEPVMHFADPPESSPLTAPAASEALTQTLFHWGLHAWACYGLAALVLAWFAYRKDQPYLAGAPLRAVFKGAWVKPVAAGADLIAVVAVAFGVAGSIGMGTLQLQSGLAAAGVTAFEGTWGGLAILLVLVVAYMASATTSLDKGIQILSNVNIVLAILLMAFVLVVGPSSELLRYAVAGLGDYLVALPRLSLRLFPLSDKREWMGGWTLTYFIWWIAWAPFTGIFIARISKGRTIREFVAGVVLLPTAFSLFWFAIFGGTALNLQMTGSADMVGLVHADVTGALFGLFAQLPMSGLLNVVSLVLIFVFLVTSVDSATYVLGMLTSRGSSDPPTLNKVGWGLALAGLGAALLLGGNVRAVQAVAISGALPFTLVMLLQAAALVRSLREKA